MELDPVLVSPKPFFHPLCVMGSPMIDEEGEFPFPVVARTEDRAGEALVGRSDDRGLALGGEASVYLGFRLSYAVIWVTKANQAARFSWSFSGAPSEKTTPWMTQDSGGAFCRRRPFFAAP